MPLDYRSPQGVSRRILPIRHLSWLFLPCRTRCTSRALTCISSRWFLWNPPIFQQDLHSTLRGSYFGVAQSHACRRPQSSARERPSAALQSRLRRQFFSVGARDQPESCPCTCMLVCPFIYLFGIFSSPCFPFFFPRSSLCPAQN